MQQRTFKKHVQAWIDNDLNAHTRATLTSSDIGKLMDRIFGRNAYRDRYRGYRDEMRQMRLEGKSVAEIAEHFGAKPVTVIAHTKDIVPKNGRVLKVDPERARDLVRKGLTYRAAGRILGVTAPSVHKAVRRQNGHQQQA